MTATPPPITWAQRAGIVYLTVCLEDCKSPEINLENQKVHFKGTGGTEKKLHEIEIQLYGEIEPEKSEKFIRDRNIELVLKKAANSSTYWPHLTKEKGKFHWLKVDFNRWKDEESSDDEGFGSKGDKNYDLEEMVKKLSGMGEGDANPGLDDLPVEDSDDEDLPELNFQ